MPFWTFNQNNSGGSFDFDEDRGITHFTVIEALDEGHAIQRAKAAGIYFDGCASGHDCPCCGDRWHEPWTDDGTEVPQVYGQDIREEGSISMLMGGWMPDGKEVCIHPLDGPLEWLGTVREEWRKS